MLEWRILLIMVSIFFTQCAIRLKTYTNFSSWTYILVLGLFIASGLSFEFFNLQGFVNDYFSLNRLLWLGFTAFLIAGLNPQKFKLSSTLVLLFLWASWNFSNLFIADGDVRLIVIRCIQATVIAVFVTSINQSKFQFEGFCKAISSTWSFSALSIFIILIASASIDPQIFSWLHAQIFGFSSNFSIFCSQFVALFLFKNLFERDAIVAKSRASMFYLCLSILPILIWQVSSGGRAGLLMTCLMLTFFALVRFGKLGALFGFFATTSVISLIDILLVTQIRPFLRHYIVERHFPLIKQGSISRGFGSFDSGGSTQLLSSEKSIDLLSLLDKASGWRISGLIETIILIDLEKLIGGYGVANFKILSETHYPHMALMRHLVELGAIGFILSSILYFKPFISKPKGDLEKFSLLYLLCFISITFLQPSGPLIHLNSAMVFWMVYAYLEHIKNT